MKRLSKASLIFLIFSAGLSAAAYGQENLGQLLDSGAKTLNADEVRTALSGASLSGLTGSGGEMQADYKADGTISGSVSGRLSRWSITGTWKVEEDGRVCGEMHPQPGPYCHHVYLDKDRYFISYVKKAGVINREAPIFLRTIKR